MRTHVLVAHVLTCGLYYGLNGHDLLERGVEGKSLLGWRAEREGRERDERRNRRGVLKGVWY